MLWVTVDGLSEHWERALVDAKITDTKSINVTTKNVSALTLSMPAGLCPLDTVGEPQVTLDGTVLSAPRVQTDRSWTVHFRKQQGIWRVVAGPDEILRKRHGLQGPIDDAFMDSFIMVTPSGSPMNPKIGAWVAGEQAHAIEHWRRQFRGEARVKTDQQITDEDIASSNLILWGDPSSNQLLAKIADKLPIRWSARGISLHGKKFPPDTYVPVFIYPNPLNPKHYIVVNSGFTFREYDYLNNARQVAKLPDYAILDISTPPNSQAPGKILNAGFFDEYWK